MKLFCNDSNKAVRKHAKTSEEIQGENNIFSVRGSRNTLLTHTEWATVTIMHHGHPVRYIGYTFLLFSTSCFSFINKKQSLGVLLKIKNTTAVWQ
jgi:hypothetical protein